MAFAGEKLSKMVDSKEREHEDVDTQALNDPNFLEALRAFAPSLSYFNT